MRTDRCSGHGGGVGLRPGTPPPKDGDLSLDRDLSLTQTP